MQDEFDPKVNRGVLPKDWHRCEACNRTRPMRALVLTNGGWRCCKDADACVAFARSTHATDGVLDEVRLERERQDAKWGVQNHPDLSPRRDRSYPERTAEEMQIPSAHTARSCCEHLAARGELGFADIALEEFAESIEAAALGDVVELRKELVQTAAVIVAWIESIDRRGVKP